MLDLATQTAQGLIDLAWLTLLHATWLGLAIGSIAAIASWLIPPGRHRARHVMLLAALATIVVGSLFAAIVQRFRPRHEVTSVTVGSSIVSTGAVSPMASDAVAARPTPPRVASGRATSGVRRLLEATKSVVEGSRPIATAAWILGVSSFGMTLLIGALSLRRLRYESIAADALRARVRALARMLRLRRVPDVRVHRRLVEPCLTGVIRPVVLLPADWLATAAHDEVDAVLAHELSHARRLDNLANLAQRVVEAFLFFHPCVLWLSRRARREAEHAADALAIRVTGDPTALARSLESVARLRSLSPRSFRLGLAIGGDRPSLLPRIQELLGMKPKRPRLPFGSLAALPAAALTAILAVNADVGASPPQAADPAPARAGRVTDVLGPVPRKAELDPRDLPQDVRNRLASSRPGRLSHDDLVTLVRTIGHDKGDPSRLSRDELLAIAAPDQISFEVRYLHVLHDPKVAIRGVSSESQPAWLIPDVTLGGLIDDSIGATGLPLHAPKVTTFDRASATVVVERHHDADNPMRVALPTFGDRGSLDGRLVGRLDGPARNVGSASSIIDRIGANVYLQMTGVRKPGGHAVELRFLGSLPEDAKAPQGARRTVERRATFNVPDGCSIMLDTGLDVVGADDAPPPAPHLRTLAVITPRHIPNDEEEEAMQGPVVEFPAPQDIAR